MRTSPIAILAVLLFGLTPASGQDAEFYGRWSGPGYYMFHCRNGHCSLAGKPEKSLSECLKMADQVTKEIEDMYEEKIDPYRCDYFAAKPADPRDFQHA